MTPIPLITMPGGIGELLGDPNTAWPYPTRPFGRPAGGALGARQDARGSSTWLGMIYRPRGQRAELRRPRAGDLGWGWDEMLPVFKTIEDDNSVLPSVHGAGEPVHGASVGESRDPLREDAITAGEASVGGACPTSTDRRGAHRLRDGDGSQRCAGERRSCPTRPDHRPPQLTVWVLALTAATSLGVFKPGPPFRRQPKSG